MKFREHHLFAILHAFDQHTLPLDVFIRNYFRSNKAIGAKDRRYIAETLYGIVRWRGLLDYLAPKPSSWENRYACYLQTSPRSYIGRSEIPLHVRVSFPKALFELIAGSYGEEKALKLCLASNTAAPTTVRANLLKTTRAELLTRWAERYSVAPTLHSPWGITFCRKINFFDTPEFREGLFEVQDEGSQLVADCVKVTPKQQVLDYCAGSGGKSLAIAPFMENRGVLYLHDIRPHALEEARKRLRRAGIQNAQLLFPGDRKKKQLREKIDWVLVDAPCSGTGTLRRNPDMKWKFTLSSVEELVNKQREIFKEALEYLAPAGKIVYATCSILPQENGEQVAFFQQELGLSLVGKPFSSLPEEGGMDGFFAAVLKKA